MLTVGVDIGGTKIAAGIVDEDGTILKRTRWDTDPEDLARIDGSIVAAITELRAGFEVGAVGIAAAGFVSPRRDSVMFAPNIAWRDYPLRDRIAEAVDLPIVVENDANAAGWAEFRFGTGREVDHMVMVTIGTGVGGAIIVDGHLLRGAYGVAAEIGHLKMVPHGHYCGCGHEGCWERYASGQALTLAARHRVITDPEGSTAMRRIAGEGHRIKGPHVARAALEGDPMALELFADLGRWIGMGCASLAAVLDPELIVIGGGVAEAGELFLDDTRRGFVDHLSARGHRPEARIELAVLGNDAGIIGAGDLARL
ncbi:MAG: ROK family glucokinase [Actinomycetota bacterium]